MSRGMLAVVVGSMVLGALAGAPKAVAQSSSWAEKVSLKGDLRYRYEYIDDETKDDTRQRDRIRARAGIFAKANDELDVGIQLTTSENTGEGGDPISGNQTLDSLASRKDVWFDLAYMDYHPAAAKGLDLVGGKMKNPFICVADNVFDADYNPEGLAATYKFGDKVQILGNGAYTWLDERSANEDDGKQYGLQLAAKTKAGEKVDVTAGVSYYTTDNLEGQPLLSSAFGNSSEKVVSGGKTNSLYAMEYEVVEGFVQVGVDVGIPVTAYGSYTVNQDADTDDTGYIVGLTLGTAKDPGSFELGYNWRSLEKDAVLGGLTDSDSFGGGTNGEGSKFTAKYQLAKNWQLAGTYFMDNKDPDNADTSYDRLQLDINAKF
jgi:hypothetical protein